MTVRVREGQRTGQLVSRRQPINTHLLYQKCGWQVFSLTLSCLSPPPPPPSHQWHPSTFTHPPLHQHSRTQHGVHPWLHPSLRGQGSEFEDYCQYSPLVSHNDTFTQFPEASRAASRASRAS